MKRFTFPCNFPGGVQNPFSFYVGDPNPKNHPLQHQAAWLASERQGSVPADVMNLFQELRTLANDHDVPFEDLCEYALSAAEGEGGIAAAAAAVGGISQQQPQQAAPQQQAQQPEQKQPAQQPQQQPEKQAAQASGTELDPAGQKG